MINNAMMYLFIRIKYELGNTTIEFINYPGQTTSMLVYMSYTDDFSTSAGLTCCWSQDSANTSKYSQSAEAPAAGFTPAENPNYNQGFAIRKGYLFSSDLLGCFEFHIPLSVSLVLPSIKKSFMV